MTILFHSCRKVKAPRQRFGTGIIASRPVYHADHTAADALWAAFELNKDSADFDLADVDAMAAEAAAMDRLEAGLCL